MFAFRTLIYLFYNIRAIDNDVLMKAEIKSFHLPRYSCFTLNPGEQHTVQRDCNFKTWFLWPCSKAAMNIRLQIFILKYIASTTPTPHR
jgi:hypothetical protein